MLKLIIYSSVRSVNQPPAAFSCQPPALYTQYIRAVLYTASIELINAYSIILIGYIPRFLLGYNTIIFYNLFNIYLISFLLKLIKSLFYNSFTKS